MGGLPDGELVRLHRNAPDPQTSEDALTELFSRYRDRLYVWCYRRVGNQEAALDMTQETLMAAFRALPAFEGKAEFSSWLYSIARNRCVSALRTPRLLVDEESDPERVPDPGIDPEEELEMRRQEEDTLDLLNTALDPEERTALWMRCYEGVSVEEITRAMDLTDKSGARALLQRARRKLRAEFLHRRGRPGSGLR